MPWWPRRGTPLASPEHREPDDRHLHPELFDHRRRRAGGGRARGRRARDGDDVRQHHGLVARRWDLGARDTLASQAYGAGQHAVCGAILQRGVALSAAGAAVVTVLWTRRSARSSPLGSPASSRAWRARTACGTRRRDPRAVAPSRRSSRCGVVAHRARRDAPPSSSAASSSSCSAPPSSGSSARAAKSMIAARGVPRVSHAVTLPSRCLLRRATGAGRARVLARLVALGRRDRAGLATFARLALPAYTMLGLEWWTFEIATLLAGLRPRARPRSPPRTSACSSSSSSS